MSVWWPIFGICTLWSVACVLVILAERRDSLPVACPEEAPRVLLADAAAVSDQGGEG